MAKFDSKAAATRNRLRLSFGINAARQREANVPNAVKLPGFALFDAMVPHQIDLHTDVMLNLPNLGDRRYYQDEDNNLIDGNSAIVAPGVPFNAVLNVRTRW